MKPRVFYAGLDVGSTLCDLVVINKDSEVVYSVTLETGERNLIRAVDEARLQVRGDLVLALEEGEMAQWIADLLRSRVTRVVVCDPKRNFWIARSSRKNDEIDALKLAKLLKGGYLKEIYHTQDADRAEFKRCVQHYHELTSGQAALQCQIKAKFRSRGVLVRGQRPFSEGGREKLLSLLPHKTGRQILLQEYRLLEMTQKAQDQAKRLMVSVGRCFSEVALLQTHPGIGPVWAATFSAYVQTPARFKNKRKLWSYCRLGITDRRSNGEPLHRKSLNRNGVGILKRLSFQAFGCCMKGDNDVREFYLESLRRTQNKTHARLNTQRKILSNLYGMWKRGESYRSLKKGEDNQIERNRA